MFFFWKHIQQNMRIEKVRSNDFNKVIKIKIVIMYFIIVSCWYKKQTEHVKQVSILYMYLILHLSYCSKFWKTCKY